MGRGWGGAHDDGGYINIESYRVELHEGEEGVTHTVTVV